MDVIFFQAISKARLIFAQAPLKFENKHTQSPQKLRQKNVLTIFLLGYSQISAWFVHGVKHDFDIVYLTSIPIEK